MNADISCRNDVMMNCQLTCKFEWPSCMTMARLVSHLIHLLLHPALFFLFFVADLYLFDMRRGHMNENKIIIPCYYKDSNHDQFAIPTLTLELVLKVF